MLEVAHEELGELVAFLRFGHDGLSRPYALHVVVVVKLLHEGVVGVLATAVAVSEHPLEVAVCEQVAELLQTNLLLVAEVGLVVLLSCGAVRWVKEEERVAARFTVGFLIVAAEDGYALQQLAVGIDGALVADVGVEQVVVGAVELSLGIGAIVGVRCLVEEDEQRCVSQSVGESCVELVAHLVEVFAALLFVKREEFLLDTS